MSVHIVQLTDLHLFQDLDGRLAGVSTWSTFHSVLEQVKVQQRDVDYIVLSGDLAQDAKAETYHMLRQSLGDWVERCRLIPGNHDNRANMRKAFPDLIPESDGAITFEFLAGDWQIIGLDSLVPGDDGGEIDREQMEWLRATLANNPCTRTLLFVHHPPVPINVSWLDEIALREPTELVGLIQCSPQVEIVCSGHVHREFEGSIGKAAMYTTPSTCVQFGTRVGKMFDSNAAGYRSFHLHADGFETSVHRLARSCLT